jgi:hypothetical protein
MFPGGPLPIWQPLSHAHGIFFPLQPASSNTITRPDALYIASSVGSRP